MSKRTMHRLSSGDRVPVFHSYGPGREKKFRAWRKKRNAAAKESRRINRG